MKKTTLFCLAACFLTMSFCASVFAGTTLNKPNPTVGWDAVTVANLPSGTTIGYAYGYKLSPSTTVTPAGTTSSLSATYALTTYGSYVFCVQSVLTSSGSVVASSEWGCSDVAANCQGGATFVDTFWPVMPIPGNLRGN